VLDDLLYQKLADETLDELGQFFEDLSDTGLCPSDYDVSLARSVQNQAVHPMPFLCKGEINALTQCHDVATLVASMSQ